MPSNAEKFSFVTQLEYCLSHTNAQFFFMRAALVVIFSFLSPMSHALWEHRKLQDCTLFL